MVLLTIATQAKSFPWIGVALALAALIVLGVLYFLPALVAYRRRHENRLAILFCNAVFGWTFLGWGLSLVWAGMGRMRPPHVRVGFDFEAGHREPA